MITISIEETVDKYKHLRICPICLHDMEALQYEREMHVYFTCKSCQYRNVYSIMDMHKYSYVVRPLKEYRYCGDITFRNDQHFNNTLILCKGVLIKTLEPRIDIYKITLNKLKLYQLFS